MLCPVCKVNPADKDDYYGYLPCKPCRDRQANLKKPGKAEEITSETIKQGRKEYWGDIHGAHRKGKASREFLEKFGKEAMKRQGFSDKEIKDADYVWNDDKPYKEGN